MQGQIALRWNQQSHLQPSHGRTSPRKLLMTAVWVILVLALSLYATRATRARQIQVPDLLYTCTVRVHHLPNLSCAVAGQI